MPKDISHSRKRKRKVDHDLLPHKKSLETLDRISPSLLPREFFDKYIARRLPVVLDGTLQDAEWKTDRWLDPEYLKSRAGNVPLSVEPKSSEGSFGSGLKREKMSFAAFLDALDENRYLTTQYDESEGSMLMPPLDQLADDIPLKPALCDTLSLQQINLWLGKAANGSSSGLHHDNADNLYCLLQGRKRFWLFPPTDARNLYPHGTIEIIHQNGTISYKEAPVRADGLNSIYAQRTKVEALQRLRANCSVMAQQEELDALIEEAEDALMTAMMEGGEEEDDFDAAFGTQNHQDSDSLGNPPSFSRVPVSTLHAAFGFGPQSDPAHDFARLRKVKPIIVDLEAGQMLYLPASYWHEVTSFSADNDRPHMALNYWFFPPDQKNYDEPYSDTMLWQHLKQEQHEQLSKVKSNLQNRNEPDKALFI